MTSTLRRPEIISAQTAAPDLAWLGSVCEVSYPLHRFSPIWVGERLGGVTGSMRESFSPHPESHPCCEFTLLIAGEGRQYIGQECVNVEAGSVMLLGPNLPHAAEAGAPSLHAITVCVLPIMFLESDPNGDGAKILRRFTAEQPISGRVQRIPSLLLRELKRALVGMLEEFRRGGFGRELRLRSLLMEALVAYLRWEQSVGLQPAQQLPRSNWSHVQAALSYLHEHHAEVIYVRELAAALRIGERQLNGLFRRLLGRSCIEYLNEYRVSIAASRLSTSEATISTVAFEVGFESLSHFNTTFRRVIGMAPTDYLGRRKTRRTTSRRAPMTSLNSIGSMPTLDRTQEQASAKGPCSARKTQGR